MLKSKYQEYQLISNSFLGCDLDDKQYRINNIQKLCHFLAHAFNNGMSVQLFELLDNPDDLSALHELKEYACFYASFCCRGQMLIAIFNSKDLDFAIGIIDSISSDYSLVMDVNMLEDHLDLESVAFTVYQLAFHNPETNAKKGRQFKGSDLTSEMKKQKLVFLKRPFVQLAEEK